MANVPLNIFDTQFFYMGVIALFVASLFDKPIRSMPVWEVTTLLGICVLNTLLTEFNLVVTTATVNMFLAVLALTIIVRYCDLDGWYKYVVAGIIINLLVLIPQKMGCPFILDTTPLDQPGGLMGNAPRLASYLTIALPFMPIWLILPAIGTGIILQEYTILALVGFVLWTREKVFALFLLLAGFFWQEIVTSIILRFNMWRDMAVPFFKQPMIGYGLGINPYGKMEGDWFFFNDYIAFVMGVGILGAVWLAFVIPRIIKKMDKSRESYAMAGLLILATVEYPFEIERLWFTIITIIAAFIVRRHYGGCKVLIER